MEEGSGGDERLWGTILIVVGVLLDKLAPLWRWAARRLTARQKLRATERLMDRAVPIDEAARAVQDLSGPEDSGDSSPTAGSRSGPTGDGSKS